MIDRVTLMTGLGILIGIIFWLGLWYRNRQVSLSFRQLVAVMFGLGLVCRLTFAFFTPTFQAPDEEPHFNYVRYLYEQRMLPVQTSKTEASSKDWEYYQPPLYYLISIPIYRFGLALFDSIHQFFLVRGIRLLSILCWSLNVLFGLKILRNLQLEDQFINLFSLGLICLLPTYTFLSASINNDNLVIYLGGVILYLLSDRRSYLRAVLLGLLLGLALLTKLSAVVYACAIAGVLTVQVLRRSLPVPTAAGQFLLIILLAGLLVSPWALRNLRVYGDLYPEAVANVPKVWASTAQAFTITQDKIKETFWTAAGIHNKIRFLPEVGVAVTYLALAGLLYSLWQRGGWLNSYFQGERGSFLLGTGLAVLINIGLALRFGMLYDQGQGRFLFPLLLPLSIFLALGLKALRLPDVIKESQIHLTGFLGLYLLAFTGHSLGFFARFWIKILTAYLG